MSYRTQAYYMWSRLGKIVYDEEILAGLEHAPGAIARLYRGANHGKLIMAVD